VKTYPIDQCRLYRCSSKKKLAELLGIDSAKLITLTKDPTAYRIFTRRTNGKERVIEEPRGELRRVHDRLLALLSRIEPPSYLHSGVKRRSYISNARQHAGGGRVLKTDVSKFYPSTNHQQVFIGFLREFCCAGDVARLLADLCTYQGHVPTGSPISMPAAFFAHKQAFDALHRRMFGQNITMTVYVDDITLSGDSLMRLHFCPIKKTFAATGMRVHKTRFFGAGPASVTGVIVKGEEILLPNRRHQRIAEGIRSLASLEPSLERLSIANTLRGQINEAANVDAICRARLLGYKALISKLMETAVSEHASLVAPVP
jgi:hypothetical protein